MTSETTAPRQHQNPIQSALCPKGCREYASDANVAFSGPHRVKPHLFAGTRTGVCTNSWRASNGGERSRSVHSNPNEGTDVIDADLKPAELLRYAETLLSTPNEDPTR